MINIDEHTVVDIGMRLSRSFTIDHLTCGAYNGYVGRYMPIFRSDFDFHDRSHDGKKLIPKWQIAYNLAYLAQNVLEPLLRAFGPRLMVTNCYSSYSRTNTAADESRHLVGSAVDFTVKGWIEDMYPIAEQARLATQGTFASFRLVYGDSSWIHIGVEPKYNYGEIGKKDTGISSLDLYTGETQTGLVRLRGETGDDWFMTLPDEKDEFSRTA